MTQAIVVMGVSGSGKSTVAEAVAEKLGVAFIEGDKLHPKSNVDKMSEGIPLTDEDRWPWLDLIGAELRKGSESNGVVVSCSALKKIYRDRLRKATGGPLAFVYLDGSLELLSRRAWANARAISCRFRCCRPSLPRWKCRRANRAS